MLLSGVSIPQRAMRQQIASAVNMIVHSARLADGSRKVLKISEVSGMEGDMIMMQDLFEFVRTEASTPAKITGFFRPTGNRSVYGPRLETVGYRTDTRAR
jgi:pilus assembly protein CpaF